MKFKMLNLNATESLIRQRLNEKTSAILEILESQTLTEMRDAPDNAMYPMSRTEVERLLSQYERRSDDPFADENDVADRSIEGAKRARWYPPEVNSDYVLDPDDLAAAHDSNNRPAKLMPYDYIYSVYRVSDTEESEPDEIEDGDDDEARPENYAGEFNVYESIEDENTCCDHSISAGKDLELELADGNSVFADSHAVEHLKNSGNLQNMKSAMGSIGEFQDFLDHAYGKSAPVEHNPVIQPSTVDDYKPNPDLEESIIESMIQAKAVDQLNNYNPNFKDLGRLAMVNRVRGGHVQLRKIISQTNGFKILDGQLVRMSPDEMRRRKRAAKISARKKEAEMAKIERERTISLRIRNSRLGHYKAVDDV